ncbi:MAG: sugar transferase [Clostridia bacterium]|nr:sugar transferase [Clostridia bacterium]
MELKRQYDDELDVLDYINEMNEKQIEEYRADNKKHYEEIEKKKIRNLISGLFKRTIDILAGLVGTILLIPITIVVYIVKKINKENGPIFYDQLRIGKNGKIFKMYKFRTMVIGADEILFDYLKENPKEAKEYEINKKLSNDPRITKSGAWLRKTSLDEWPQFVAILIGQMSLVGPRPYLPREKKDMGQYYDYIIKVKPGLTGPWQVAGRSNLTFEDRLKLDEEYISRCGNKRDIKIILKTIKKVFRKEGAI